MKKVYNIPREQAEWYCKPLDSNECAWISIQEPGSEHIKNDILDDIPNLKMKFWDIDSPGMYLMEDGSWETIEPITDSQLDELFNFIMEHKNKSIITNCRMGISRSGAVSNFCSDLLGHEWDSVSQHRAVPNRYIYRELVNRYEKMLTESYNV